MLEEVELLKMWVVRILARFEERSVLFLVAYSHLEIVSNATDSKFYIFWWMYLALYFEYRIRMVSMLS